MTGGGTHDTNEGTKWMSVPLGVSYFPKEIFQLPTSWVHSSCTNALPSELTGPFHRWTRNLGKLVFEAEHSKGGHFAAHEHPDVLVGDLRKMFGKGGPAYGAVAEKDGFA